MQEVKTPNKRNSLANQNAFKSVKKEKHTPNKSTNKALKGKKFPFKKDASSPTIQIEPNTNKVNQNKTGIATLNNCIDLIETKLDILDLPDEGCRSRLYQIHF